MLKAKQLEQRGATNSLAHARLEAGGFHPLNTGLPFSPCHAVEL